jgi:tRNA 2-thiouridine synthesizing protein E
MSTIATIALKERGVSVDDEGFLIEPEEWTEAVARVLAAREGIAELTEEQLDILRFMRTYYGRHHFFPIVRFVCRSVGQPGACITDRFSDPVTAWKIAGLPNPGEQVNRFRSWNPLGF